MNEVPVRLVLVGGRVVGRVVCRLAYTPFAIGESYQLIPVANPGSKRAVDHGCLCESARNNFGVGHPSLEEPEVGFHVDPACPIHRPRWTYQLRERSES